MRITKPYVCPDCGKPCDAIEYDNGIGPYEFWGRKGIDSQPYFGSDCCEAEIPEAEPTFDDRADYEYERMRDDD